MGHSSLSSLSPSPSPLPSNNQYGWMDGWMDGWTVVVLVWCDYGKQEIFGWEPGGYIMHSTIILVLIMILLQHSIQFIHLFIHSMESVLGHCK